MTGESVRSDAAVAGTAGRILTYGGAPAITYYFSTSGGHTENIQYSFVGASQALARGRDGPLRRPLAVPPLAGLLLHGEASAARSGRRGNSRS